MSRVIPRLTQGPSLADQAYRVLRQMLTDGDLEPGERLTERGLATRLGVSPTPVREAIRRLEHERLLERNDGRTLTVAQPSLRRLAELREIEAALRQKTGDSVACFGSDDNMFVAVEKTGDKAAVVEILSGMYGLHRTSYRVLCVQVIPHTVRGKIDYPALVQNLSNRAAL